MFSTIEVNNTRRMRFRQEHASMSTMTLISPLIIKFFSNANIYTLAYWTLLNLLNLFVRILFTSKDRFHIFSLDFCASIKFRSQIDLLSRPHYYDTCIW